MDIDSVPTQGRSTYRVAVSRDSPYDLEHLASTWDAAGRSKISRLIFVSKLSPSLAGPALTLALNAIKALTLDVRLYEETFQSYRKFINAVQKGDEADDQAKAWLQSVQGREEGVDRVWADKARKEAQSGQDKLELELKGYMTNLIKESIRMGHRDLARFQYRTGDLQAAVRSYTKSREFCTTSQHVLEMCLGVIEVALDMSNYAFVRNYVVKAESALDAAQTSAQNSGKNKTAPVNLPGMVAPAQDPVEAAKERERKVVLERLTVAGAVAHLGSGAYEKAALSFTDVGSEALVSGPAHFIPAADIALYATITGLASFSRSQLKTRILENPNLRPFLDLGPYLRDIVRAFYESRFKEGLELLQKHEARFLLDLHLSPHYPTLLLQIQHRSLSLFFSPFSSVSLSRMSHAFGWSEPVLTAAVVELIGRGVIKARVDSARGVLVAKKVEARTEAFKNALQLGERGQKKARAGILRMKLLQADLVVKPAKGRVGGGPKTVTRSSGGGGVQGGGAIEEDEEDSVVVVD
ncbi:hypothetical protein JCM11641_006968 [Rhodosporidiobolus odoratus]